ncbi:MAG: transcription termination/antitermination factor NusG [Clostridia bacterium]|nr:transcription termination/antitermination factor NusG [Clostridia bacterium]MBR3273043.1 transcription termination/antitermination factor NusG [Clostridia bacterium]
MSENADIKWYVVHTYSGYENKVRDSLLKAVENNGMQDKIVDVRIPVEEAVEIKNNKRRVVQRKLLPSYVIVKMEMTNETWYLVRNTRGVTGFVGSGNKPTPLSETDFASIFDTAPQARIDIQVGDEVRILTGLFENFTGKVTAIDPVSQQLSVTVPMLKRETSVDLAYDEVVRVD